MQSDENPLVGCAGRTDLLKVRSSYDFWLACDCTTDKLGVEQRLGCSIQNYPEFFGGADGSIRPGLCLDISAYSMYTC